PDELPFAVDVPTQVGTAAAPATATTTAVVGRELEGGLELVDVLVFRVAGVDAEGLDLGQRQLRGGEGRACDLPGNEIDGSAAGPAADRDRPSGHLVALR